MSQLNRTIDHHATNARIVGCGCDLTFIGPHVLVYDRQRWSVWNGNPDTDGEIVALFDADLVLSLVDGVYHLAPSPGTAVTYAATDYELVRDLELERANEVYNVAKRIVELYDT